jgi:hypothetical protein
MTVYGFRGCRVVVQPAVVNGGIWRFLAGITSQVGVTASIRIVFTPGTHEVLEKR